MQFYPTIVSPASQAQTWSPVYWPTSVLEQKCQNSDGYHLNRAVKN